jgi:V/A-type H+-transporting ATPase subunit C
MVDSLIGLVARAKGLATRLLPRPALEALADADDLDVFARGLSSVAPQIGVVGMPVDVFTIEHAIGHTAQRYVDTLDRWREQAAGVLDIHAARQDRHTLRAMLRGAAAGAAPSARLGGSLPTTSLSQPALARLAVASSPADVVHELVLLGHPDARRLLPLVHVSQVDLFAVDVALLAGFAERATHTAARADQPARDFVHAQIDAGNVQSALWLATGAGDVTPAEVFVRGGRWLSEQAFITAAAVKPERALMLLAAALAASPLWSALPAVAGDAALDRLFLIAMLRHLTRAARLEPLSTAPVLRVLLLIDAQSRDLRALAWGAEMRTPATLRKQQLVTPP